MNNIFKQKSSFIKLVSILVSILYLTSLNAQSYPEKGDFAKGAKTWSETCARCHNMRDPKDLRDDQWVTTVFHMRVRAGLTGQQTRDILTFLQESNNNAQKTVVSHTVTATEKPSGLSGEQIYMQTCIACHGGNGVGTVPGAPDFTKSDNPLSQSDEVLVTHIVEGFKTPGSPMAMPPKGGNSKLTTEDVKAVVKYMKDAFKY
jgi:cytochrome c5